MNLKIGNLGERSDERWSDEVGELAYCRVLKDPTRNIKFYLQVIRSHFSILNREWCNHTGIFGGSLMTVRRKNPGCSMT